MILYLGERYYLRKWTVLLMGVRDAVHLFWRRSNVWIYSKCKREESWYNTLFSSKRSAWLPGYHRMYLPWDKTMPGSNKSNRLPLPWIFFENTRSIITAQHPQTRFHKKKLNISIFTEHPCRNPKSSYDSLQWTQEALSNHDWPHRCLHSRISPQLDPFRCGNPLRQQVGLDLIIDTARFCIRQLTLDAQFGCPFRLQHEVICWRLSYVLVESWVEHKIGALLPFAAGFLVLDTPPTEEWDDRIDAHYIGAGVRCRMKDCTDLSGCRVSAESGVCEGEIENVVLRPGISFWRRDGRWRGRGGESCVRKDAKSYKVGN